MRHAQFRMWLMGRDVLVLGVVQDETLHNLQRFLWDTIIDVEADSLAYVFDAQTRAVTMPDGQMMERLIDRAYWQTIGRTDQFYLTLWRLTGESLGREYDQ